MVAKRNDTVASAFSHVRQLAAIACLHVPTASRFLAREPSHWGRYGADPRVTYELRTVITDGLGRDLTAHLTVPGLHLPRRHLSREP